MDDQALGINLAPCQNLGEQVPGEAGVFLSRDHPANDVAAEQIQDDVEVQVHPPGQGRQLGDVPGHDLVRCRRLQLRLDVVLGRALVAPFPALIAFSQTPVHGGNRGNQLPFAEQRGVDLPRGCVLEAFRVQMIQQCLILGGAQPPPHGGFRLALIAPPAVWIAPVPRGIQGPACRRLGNASGQ